MSAGCTYCGAPVKAREQGGIANSANAWSETRYECGTKNHSDGVDQSAECIRREAEAKVPEGDVVSVPAILVIDAAPAPTPVAAVTPKSLEQQVAEWRETTEAAAMAAVEAVRGVTIADHVDGPIKGRKAVEAARLALKKVRTPIEARRKELKAPIVALGKLVDEEAAQLIALVKPREEELENEVLAYDAEQARIKRDAEAAERARIQGRVDQAVSLGATPDVSMISVMTDEAFAAWVDELRAAKALRDAEEAAREAQREQERKAEAEKLEAERAERERQEKEVRDRIAAAEKALEVEREALARDRADLDAARKVLKDQQDKVDAEARAEQKRKDDQAKAEADAKAELERLAKEDQERLDALARREALRPDREKIATWCEAAANAFPILPWIDDPELRLAANDCVTDALNRINILATETKENT